MKNDDTSATAANRRRFRAIVFVARPRAGKTSLSFSTLTAARVHHYFNYIIILKNISIKFFILRYNFCLKLTNDNHGFTLSGFRNNLMTFE